MEQVRSREEALVRQGTQQGGIFENVVMGILTRMRKGHVRITLPSGEVVSVGDETSPTHASLRIVRNDFFRKCVLAGDIGFGEAYVDGDWETDDLPLLLRTLVFNLEDLPLSGSSRSFVGINVLKGVNRLSHLLRRNSRSGSRRNISEHYDLSNEFFRLWLDPSMMYSSAIYAHPEMTLEEAQREKVDRLCRHLKIRPGDRVLEIGTGWGTFAIHAARQYGARVTTITVSRQQFEHASARVRDEGLQDQIDVRFQDYRTLEGEWDRVASIEMLEAVGHEHLREYFRVCQRVLTKDGLIGVQVITSPDARYEQFRTGVDWIQKHIFPGSLLPSVGALVDAVRATGPMHLHHLEDHGLDYARTLSEWRSMFNATLDRVKLLGFDDRFIRKWNYYLSYCEAGFAMRNISVVQMVFTAPNNAVLR